MRNDSDISLSDATKVASDWEALGRLVRRGALEAVALHFVAEGVARCADGPAHVPAGDGVEGGA